MEKVYTVTPASNMAMFEYLCYISDVYIYILCMYECRYIYIYTPRTQMTLVLIEKCLVLEG